MNYVTDSFNRTAKDQSRKNHISLETPYITISQSLHAIQSSTLGTTLLFPIQCLLFEISMPECISEMIYTHRPLTCLYEQLCPDFGF